MPQWFQTIDRRGDALTVGQPDAQANYLGRVPRARRRNHRRRGGEAAFYIVGPVTQKRRWCVLRDIVGDSDHSNGRARLPGGLQAQAS